MLGMAESRIMINLPSDSEVEDLSKNITFLVAEIEESILRSNTAKDEQLVTDVWVGVVLTVLVLSCAACMCTCLLYHRFQLWKMTTLQARTTRNTGNVESADGESLPSYTIVSGLPSYDEALKQLKIVKDKQMQQQISAGDWVPHTPPTPMVKLSVTELFQFYKTNNISTQSTPTTPAEQNNEENKS